MKTGLILVDIQNDYFAGGRMELAGMRKAGLNAGDLLSNFRRKSWPTFHIQHIAAQKGATFFLPETEGAALHESIKPQRDLWPGINTRLEPVVREDNEQYNVRFWRTPALAASATAQGVRWFAIPAAAPTA